MKRIIDISEDYYEIIKHEVEHGNDYKPFVLLANSTPLNECEAEDCISRGLTQEPRKGHWINTANPRMSDNIVCSECGYNSIADYKFCPNCGAKMDIN